MKEARLRYNEYMARKGFASRLRNMLKLVKEKGMDPGGICLKPPTYTYNVFDESCMLCSEIIHLELPEYSMHSCPCHVLGSEKAIKRALEWLRIEEAKEKQINLYRKQFIHILKILLKQDDGMIDITCPQSMTRDKSRDRQKFFCMFCYEVVINYDIDYPFASLQKFCPCELMGLTRAKDAANLYIKKAES